MVHGKVPDAGWDFDMLFRFKKWFVLTATITAFVLASVPAFAHAILEESQPANNATVSAGKIVFHLTYNSRIDRDRSILTVVDANQSKSILPKAEAPTANILTGSMVLSPGRYKLYWQVLSTDGHITRGQISFTVTGG